MPILKGKDPQVLEIRQGEMMGREEADDRRSLSKRIPIKQRRRTIKASTGGMSSLDFNLFSDFENITDALETTEPGNEGTSTLEPPSVFAELKRN